MFYSFHQNNSGGSFFHDAEKGIGYHVIIEADSLSEAEDKALNIGLYFNGVDEGSDCPCCGDRWYSGYKADEEPSYYGTPVSKKPIGIHWDIPSYIHYKDGRIVEA